MISLVRKNLACLIPKHDKSLVSPRCFSTSTERVLVNNLRIYNVLVHKHHFSPEVASLARPRNPEKAEVLLSFLNENGFSSTQLEKIVKYSPRILSYSVQNIEFKIKIFRDLGLSNEDIAKIVSTNQKILGLSGKDNIIPSLSLLKGLLGSDYDVSKLLTKSAWFLTADLHNTLVPNVELLKSSGIPMDRIIYFLFSFPRCLLVKPDSLRNAVDKAKQMGFTQSSNMFVHAIGNIASMRKGMWEVKLQAFRVLGFSDSDIFTMFKKAPHVFKISLKKVEEIKELLLATGKFDISSIVSNPASLGCSIERRYRPRLRILGILESKNLIEKWPGLAIIHTLTDDKFFEKYISPYSNELGEVFPTMSHIRGKGR